MRFREGRSPQKFLFALLLAFYAVTLSVAYLEEASHFDEMLSGVGWRQGHVWPTTEQARQAGLRFGSQVIAVNGVDVDPEVPSDTGPPWRLTNGATNHLQVKLPNGQTETLQISVVKNSAFYTWQYVRLPLLVGFVYVAVGVVTFILRPWERQSSAILSTSVLIGCWLSFNFTERFVPRAELTEMLGFFLNGVIVAVPFHMGLTFPIAHPVYLKRPGILALLYSACCIGFVAMFSWMNRINMNQVWRLGELIVTGCALAGVIFFIRRTAQAALHPPDRLTRQRARVLLLAAIIAFGPVILTSVAQPLFNRLMIDRRLLFIPMVVFPLTMMYTVFRHDVFTTRSVVQRSVVYTVASVIALIGAFVLITLVNGILDRNLQDFAPILSGVILALFMLPMLFAAPVVDRWFTDRLYPKRKQLPALLREIADEFAAATSIENIMDILIRAPERTCDATSAGVIFFPGAAGEHGQYHSTLGTQAIDADRLSEAAIFQFLRTTKRRIRRFTVSAAPHFEAIREESLAVIDSIIGHTLLPILRRDTVIGALIIGPRERNDDYNTDELEALQTLVQQAVLALVRNEALDRIRTHDQEVADMKRVLPPHVVDTVIAKGGVSAFRTRRKPVTVFFCDLRGFTGFSDSVEPEEVMHTLSQFHSAMGRRIQQFGGTLEHFAGDGFMVFFNDPEDDPDHVIHAASMAAAMRKDVTRLRAEWQRKGYGLDVGMGIHTGYATCGFVGYEGRHDYAVIGNVTNLAARLCDHAQGGEILVSQKVVTELGGKFVTEPVGEISLRGFHLPQLTFRVLEAARV